MGEHLEKKLTTIEEVADMAEAASQQRDAERRRFARTPIKGVLKAHVQLAGSPGFMVTLRDLSRGGIGFKSDRHMPRNEQFVLAARLNNAQLRMVCQTKRCYLNKGGEHYIVGAQILDVQRHKMESQQMFEEPAGEVDLKHVAAIEEKLKALQDGTIS